MESKLDRYLRWCKTKTGQRSCAFIFSGLNIGTFAAFFFPHTFWLKKYEEFMKLYKDDKPVTVPESITSLVNEVFEDLKIDEFDRTAIKPFMCSGFDTFHAGSVDTKYGGVIGIPLNFTYNTTKDVDSERILVNNVLINWARQDSEDLAYSLVLSPEAKKFAIGREILTILESSKIWESIAPCSFFIVCYLICQWLKNKYNMYKKSLASRSFLYAVVGFGGISLYYLQKDYFRKKTERKVDETLSKISPTYVKGGHDFYSKLLTRNIAHRSLLDQYGEEVFTEEGDYAYFIRQKTTPITKRKLLFESMVKEFMQEQEKKLNSDLNKIAGDVEKA